MSIQKIGCAFENFRRGRPAGLHPAAIVIHIIVGSLKSADATFNDPKSNVSAHYGVGKSGEIHQYVEEDDTAFHAGIVDRPTWRLIQPGVNPNFYTVGIEHEGLPEDEWTDPMYAASASLIGEISSGGTRIPLDRDHVIMHREIRASKTCPGSKVDMERLIREAAKAPLPVVAKALEVTTLVEANLRLGAPSTSVPIVRVIPAQTQLQMVSFTPAGQVVKGNPFWYQDAGGNFLWAGTTDRPSPQLL